jgi:hypothetical protein
MKTREMMKIQKGAVLSIVAALTFLTMYGSIMRRPAHLKKADRREGEGRLMLNQRDHQKHNESQSMPNPRRPYQRFKRPE